MTTGAARHRRAPEPALAILRQRPATAAARPGATVWALRNRCLVGQAMALALWNAPAFAQNVITTDGRTQTAIAVEGAITTITTRTIAGGAGYNSFNRFEQGAGSTVNMHLPQNTGALVNIVRSGPVVVNGILNSYRNGSIGGHVYFSDSSGFTVGPSGVINTGRLTVNTPTREFLDGVISPGGVVNETLAARLRANDVPVSPDGAISIEGRINAKHGVTLHGHSVSVSGQIAANSAPVDVGERRRRHQTAFAASVNTSGVTHGGAMVARKGGGIEIVAAGTARISGTLSANATTRRSAGSIVVRSGKGTTITQTARLSAQGAAPSERLATGPAGPAVNIGDGGAITLTSDGAIAILGGARFDASAAPDAAGKGGAIKVLAGTNLGVEAGAVFRGKGGLSGDGGFLELSAKKSVIIDAADIDLSAQAGKAGTFLIDPEDLVINSAQVSVNGANVELLADNSITIAAGGVIDTRQFDRSANGGVLSAANPSTGSSGSITLTAPNISVFGSLLAGVSTGSAFTAGNVTLDATTSDIRIYGRASATSTIDIHGTITGKDVTLTADATAVASYLTFTPGGLLANAAQTTAGILFGLNGGYVGSELLSRIRVGGGASISATNDVSVIAKGKQEASMPAITITGGNAFGGAVSIGEIAGTVTADIASGASISVGRNLAVRAENDVKLGVSALVVSVGTGLVAATVAYGNVDVTTTAKVHSGASITTSGVSNVAVTALNTNSFSTGATAMAASGGVAGASVAWSEYKAETEALLGASLGTSANKVQNVTVQAVTDTAKNATSASTTVGDNMIFNAGSESTTVSTLLSELFGKLSSASNSVPVKAGSAIAIADSRLSAKASIAADPGGTAPTIHAAGNVAVASRQYDFGVRLIADSAINSKSTDPTSAQPRAEVSLSFGIGVGNYRHDSTAFIGSGVTINAFRAGVAATNEMPIANTWTNWAGPSEAISHINGNLGVVNNIMTSYGNASSQSNELGLAGSVTYFRANNDTSAYVASGATINTTSLSPAWTTTLANDYVQNFSQAVSVFADTTIHSIDGGGNFGLTGGVNGGAGSAAGGTLITSGRTSRTIAAIADGATITTSSLAVTATTSDKMFLVVTSSGKSKGVALNGMVGLASLDNETLASISNRAFVTADLVDVRAEQFVSMFSLGGALVMAGTGGSSFGISVGRIDATTVTRAYIGDNSDDLSDDRLGGAGTTLGRIRTDSLTVQAATTGRLAAASIAAAVVDGTGNFSDDPFFVVASSASAAQGGGKPSFALAGSAAIASTQLGTSAWVDGARIEAKTTALSTAVRSLNSTIIEVGSGSAALNLSGTDGGTSVSLAGAIAFAKLDNSTDARISHSSLTNIGDTRVQAIAGGRVTAVGLGIAGAADGTGAAAISAALGLVTNRVSASIADSTLLGAANALSNLVSVNAYQTTDIGIGGGAAYFGAKTGVGLALTYTEIKDPDGEDAVSATVTRSRIEAVDGLVVTASSASRIISSAISAGLGGNGLAGSFVFNSVTPTVRASIDDNSAAPPTITLSGDVVVISDGSRDSALDAIITGRQTFAGTDTSQIDFTGAVTNNGTANPTGASILAIAGAVQGGDNNVGVSLLSNRIAQSHIATIQGARLTTTGDVIVRAQDGAIITGVAVGLGVATGKFAGVASVTLQSIDNVVRAGITGANAIVTARDISVSGSAGSLIRGTAGSLGLSLGQAAFGLSIVENSIDSEVGATIEDARLRASRDVVAKAESDSRITTLAIGIAIAQKAGLAGSVATSSIATDVLATVKRADIIAENNIGVIATNHDRIAVSAGALGAAGGSPSVAGGLSIVSNSIGGSTVASIGEASTVDARVNGTGSLSVASGAVVSPPSLSDPTSPSTTFPDLAMATRNVRGLAVIATSRQAVMANAVTAGIALYPLSGAVGYVTIRNNLGGETLASIDSSTIDTRLNAGQNPTAIVVDAASHSYAGSYIVVGAIGGAAGAGADAHTTLRRRTSAALTNSTTGTIATSQGGLGGVGAVQIAATSSQSSTGKTIGFSVGGLGAAASGLVNSFEAVTTANVDQGLLNAASLRVTADSTNGFYGVAGVGAAGGVALGSAFVVARSQNTTLATIGGGPNVTTLNIFGTLNVLATNNNRFTALAAGGAAAGIASVAGMVNLIDVANTTRAGLYGVSSTQRTPPFMQQVGQAIDGTFNVIARETTTITPKTGVASIGGSGIGAGSATNVASLDSSVLADLVSSTVTTPGAVVVQAVSDRHVDANAFTVGQGGSLGLGAAVNVISVGTGAPAGADLNIGGNGTLSRVNQLTAVDPGLTLSTSGLATYRTLPGVNPAGRSDEQLRAAANTEYLALIQNGVVVNGVLTLTSSGVSALRANAATALSQTSPTDSQVRDYAAARYTALKAANLQYVIGDAGLNSYREIVEAATPNATDTQVRIAANDAYATLLANGAPVGGLYSLRQTGIAVYQAAANAELGRTATDVEVRDYAAAQYAWFTSNRARTATPSAISATALLDSTGAQTGATALGGAITAASVSVTSTSKTSTENVSLGIGVGGIGVGAALGYTTVADTVSARLDQATVTTGAITVNASAIDGAAGAASRIDVRAGAGAGTAAAGAAVAQGSVSNTLTARLGGTLTVTGATIVNASTTQGSRADALGAAAGGGGALGVSLASSSLNSTVKADLAANATLSGGTSLSVTASSAGVSYAAATAGAGGLLVAGVGADARASDSSRVEAHLGDNASVNVGTGAITVSATATPDAKAAAYGVSVTGGLAVGVALSRATVNQTVIAAMDGGAAAQRAITAGSLSILATSAIFGTPVTSIGGAPGSTGQFSRGGTGAAAWSFAGSGAYYASAVGSDASAFSTSTVTASAGNNVRLPNGIVRIAADNTTRQIASSTGFSIAGKYAVGAVLAKAGSMTTTSATLGDDARLLGGSASSFSLTATGSDTQIAKAVSGSGGLVAGAGAQADTDNKAMVTARVGARAQIGANTILVTANHADFYANLVDATQAAALGASASLANHNATSDALVDIGASVIFGAIGNGTQGCYVTSCLQGIELESRNIFRQLALGDTISAGAGGGINGVGAKSTIGIDGTSKVIVGNDVAFASGGNAVSSPGPITIQAITELEANDTVTLTTGGLLQGSGVTSQYRADTDNEVALGTSNVLNSAGTINIGTYTTATVKTNAFVSTSGIAAVGVAEADTNIRTDQVITIGANSTLTGLDNVNVTAGRDASGLFTTSISGDASAIGYVRGLIAVPDADAATDLQNHAILNVHTGAALLSAQNVTLGAYNGTVTPKTHGAGHGFQLFLIPVTQRDESPGSLATSTVAMNGRAVGGVFHQQEIIIGCGAGGLSICDLNAVPTVYINAGSAPVTVTRDDAFDAEAYVRANYTTFTGEIAETAVADTLVGGIFSEGTVRAYRISQLYAAGGNVYVNGDAIQGSGTLTANGGPTIKVVNNSSAYLVLDSGAYIPDLSTGQILFTGAAQGQGGLGQTPPSANASASVIIDNAYTRSDIGNFGPALLIAGDIMNLGGLVSINNTEGSFGFSGQRIDSLQFNVTVPKGAVAIASNGPNGMYNAGASPQAEWAHAITYPGATPGAPSHTYVINDTVNAIANTLYSSGNLNYNLYHRIEDGGNPALRFSTIFYGNCIGYGATGHNCVGGYDFGNRIGFALIPVVPRYRESNSVQPAGSGSQIYGAQVAIKASVININASIEAGRVTNRSVVLESNLVNPNDIFSLAAQRQRYLAAPQFYGPVVDVSTTFAALYNNGFHTAAAGDKIIPVQFDLRSGQFIVADVNASAGGGSVLLDGQIISTNQLGRIKINGGFGHVNIVNNTGYELVTNRINTGTAAGANASTSKITIIDRLITSGPNTTVYAYTPGAGIAVYKSMNGAQPILSGANATPRFATIAGDTTTYDVKDGTRYEWTQQLTLLKDGLRINDPNAQGVWRYASGSPNNPWVYVSAPATGFWGSGNSSGQSFTTSTTPQGRVTHNEFHYASNPVFIQTHQGGANQTTDYSQWNAMQTYGNCNGQAISHCDRDFVGDSGSRANTYWNYNYVIDAWLQVTASVRADYDFGISFAGNASGVVNITSNASIGQRGAIINPTGATNITASSGSFSQAPQVSILSNHLTLYGRDSVGSVGSEIKATLTSGAAIAAYSGAGGIHLNIDSDAKIWRLNADLDAASGRYGDINVRATGGLEVANWAPADFTHALGNNITITSRNGAVGGINTPLRMQAMATTLANGSQTGGVVNISAQGDIGIRQLSGNLRVGQIASTGGNVRVDVVSGTLKAANAQTAAQSLSTEQLSTISSKLKLTQATGADAAAQASVVAFERNVTQTYTLYSSLIRNGSVSNGVFTLDATAAALYQPLATAAGMTVEAYVADRYANYASVFERAYGANWSAQARFQEATLESNFSFTTASPGAAGGLAASITANSVWQTGQLVAAIDQAALQPASGVVGNGTPIIIGRDVSLNIGGSIGSLAPDVTVNLDAIRNGTLSNTELQALAVATTPGSVKLVGTNGAGQRVNVTSLGTVPNGVTLTSVDIAQTAPLFISATGTFSGSAQGDIYLQATTAGQAGSGSLDIGRVTATGQINLQAPQAITVATAQNSTTPLHAVQIEAGTNLTLSAAGGGIGSAATPLTYQIGGRLISASAGAGDAYLVKPSGNAEIGRVFAQGTASITASAGSITSYLPGVAVSAQNVVLNASGNVGSATTPFAVQSADDGEISGQIGGSGWISTPTLASQTAIAQRIGALTAAGSLTLSADAELRVLRNLAATSGALSATAGSIVMETGATATAAGRVTLASATNVTLGRVSSALVAPQGTASIALTAAGAITGHAGVVNLNAAQAGGVIALNAGTGIGTALNALSFAAPSLSARSLQGNVTLRTASATRVTGLTADAGTATIAADGALTVDALTSGGVASASSTASTLTVTTLNAGATTNLTAAGLVSIGSATVTNGDLVIASTSGGITAATLNAAGAASLTAPGAISVTASLTSGGGAGVTSTGSTLNLVALTAGGGASLSGSGAVTLGSARTTSGDLSVASLNAGVTATTLNAAGALALNAPGAISVATATSGTTTQATSSAGTLSITTLLSGGAATLAARNGVSLSSATTALGDLSISSSVGGITAATLNAAGAASLTAPGAISVTTSLTSGGGAAVASTGGTLNLAALTAGGSSTLSGWGAVTLGGARTTSGDLSASSTTAGIDATTLNAAGAVTLTAPGAIAVATATSGTTTQATSSTGTLAITTLTSGNAATLTGRSGVTLGSATTSAGDLTVGSSHAGITAAALNAAGAARLTAQGAISVTTSLTSGGGASVTSNGSTLNLAALTAGGATALSGSGAVTLGSARTINGDLSVSSTTAGIDATTLNATGALTLTAPGAIAVTTATSGTTTQATSSAGTLAITTLISGNAATLAGRNGVALGSATSTLSTLSVTSSHGDITATTLNGRFNADAIAAGAVQVTTVQTNGTATLRSTGSTLAIATLTAADETTLAARDAVTLGAISSSRLLKISSTAAGVVGTTISGARIEVDAPGSVLLTTVTGGLEASIRSGLALTIDTLTVRGNATLAGRILVSLGTVSTTANPAFITSDPPTPHNHLAISSSDGSIVANTLSAAGNATLTASDRISVTTSLTALRHATLTATNDIQVAELRTTPDLTQDAFGVVAKAASDITVTSTMGGFTATTVASGGYATISTRSAIAIGNLTSSAERLRPTVQVIPASVGNPSPQNTPQVQRSTAIASSHGSLRVDVLNSAASRSLLSADGNVTLGSITTTRQGELVVTSASAGINGATLTAAGAATLSAAQAITVATLASGEASTVQSSGGTVAITTLTAGGASTISGRNGVTLGSATTTVGDLTVASSHGGVAAAILDAAGAATLTARDAISVTSSLTSGGSATVTATAGTIDIVAGLAGGALTYSASGSVTIGSARSSAGDVVASSASAGVTAATLDAFGAATLTAPGAILVTTLTSGGATEATSSAGALGIVTLTAGATSRLSAAGAVALGSATTMAGDLAVTSSGAGLGVTALTAAGAANLSAAQAITIDTLISGGSSDVQSSAGAIDIATLSAGATSQIAGATSVLLGAATTSAGDLRVRSGGSITATRLAGASRAEASAPGAIAIATLTSGAETTATSTGGALRIETLSSGGTATLGAAAGITLDSAETLAGDLIATSSAGIQGRSLIAARAVGIEARGLIALTEATSGTEMSVVSTAGIVRAARLRAGTTMTVEGAGGVDLQSALALSGDLALRSADAGLALGEVRAGRDLALLAQTTIVADSLTAGRDLSAASQGATLAIRAFTASRDTALSANGAIALDNADAGRNLSIASVAAGVTLQAARAGGTALLDAAGLLSVATLRSGGAATLSGGSLAVGDLIAGDSTTLRGTGAVSLGSVSTLLGDIAVASVAGRIDATSLDAAGALAAQAASAVQIGTARSGVSAAFAAMAGDVAVTRLTAGRDASLIADGAVRLVDGGAGRTLTLTSANGLVSAGTARAGGDIEIAAQTIVFGALDAGRDARLASAGSIDGDSIVATEALAALAGASGAGSIAIAAGAARNSAFTAQDGVRLGRYGAGDSIVILGNTIVSNIVQLAGASGRPLDLTIAGSRGRTAEQVTLSVEAAAFRTTRFEAVDGALTTTSRRFDLLQTFVPGALRLDAPGLRVLANNRSPAPLNGFDVQLYQRDRPFFVSLNGGSLTTNAMVIRFDADQISIPGGNGGEPEVSMARDMPRLGASMPTGPSFGEIARGFVLDATGRWRNADPETTASVGGGAETRVNLAGGEEQP